MFERYEERIVQINDLLKKYQIISIDEAVNICETEGFNCFTIVRDVQSFAFDDVVYYAYIAMSIVIKHRIHNIDQICDILGETMQAFCILSSIADIRKIGNGHAELTKKLLSEETKNFVFVAGHESFAAAEGAISLSNYANQYRKSKINVSLLGMGKQVADIISRYMGFTYVYTQFDHDLNRLVNFDKNKYGLINVDCYGCNSVEEGVCILGHIKPDLIMTGNSTNHVKFTDAAVATYKKQVYHNNQKIFCVASGGGTGRTMHPDNVNAGGGSYGMTDTMGRTHCDVQFAGSSSVPNHVELVGFLGIGNNPLVGLNIKLCYLLYEKINGANKHEK